MYTALYDVVGVSPQAAKEEIKSVFRAKAKMMHPDKGGNPVEFDKLKRAFDVLKDPTKRKRYDETGRTTASLVDEDRIRSFFVQTMLAVVEAADPMGRTDDPAHEDIHAKLIFTISNNLGELQTQEQTITKKLKRAGQLRKRFKLKDGLSFNPVEEGLIAQIRRLEKELESTKDKEELTKAVLETLGKYNYEVDDWGAGQSLFPSTSLMTSGSKRYGSLFFKTTGV
jgi:curved DNA-binding protein CbpA